MLDFSSINWSDILVARYPFEMVFRGTLMYLGLLFVLRVVLKRQSGSLSASDLLVTLLISEAAQNGMAYEYSSVPDGLILVATIVLWDYAMDWASFHFSIVRRFISSPPMPVIINGKLHRRNMRRELVSERELWIRLRQNGIERLEDVKRAFLESDGEISVIKYKDSES